MGEHKTEDDLEGGVGKKLIPTFKMYSKRYPRVICQIGVVMKQPRTLVLEAVGVVITQQDELN